MDVDSDPQFPPLTEEDRADLSKSTGAPLVGPGTLRSVDRRPYRLALPQALIANLVSDSERLLGRAGDDAAQDDPMHNWDD